MTRTQEFTLVYCPELAEFGRDPITLARQDPETGQLFCDCCGRDDHEPVLFHDCCGRGDHESVFVYSAT